MPTISPPIEAAAAPARVGSRANAERRSGTAIPGTPPLAAAIETWRVLLETHDDTDALANELAGALRPGDLVALSGSLGVGKTAMARALIRALAQDDAIDVPSPTFTLLQTYDTPRGAVVHADLFRLVDPGELDELGWDDASENAIVLVEWPERAGSALSAHRLDVTLTLDADGGRIATLTGTGPFAARLARIRDIQALLSRAGWSAARRDFMQGDASSRAYERLTLGDCKAVLMIAPRRTDGPPIRYGRSYSSIAKLAESVHAFVAMDRALLSVDASAPVIIAQDLDAGLLLIEDLGTETVVDRSGPIFERYEAATGLLVHLHGLALPSVLPVEDGRDHVVPDYDIDALLIEAELLLDWYAPQIAGVAIAHTQRTEFLRLWAQALTPVLAAPRTWSLRDYHSPNLIWLPDREGLARVGVIDFQDAVMGHPAYDVVSLLQDARVDVIEETELRLLGHYTRSRRAAEPVDRPFDPAAFLAAYAILGAQRATKIAGIFARLDKRDGKPHYLRHLPRIERHLVRNLDHPALHDLKLWYQTTLPRLFESHDRTAENRTS